RELAGPAPCERDAQLAGAALGRRTLIVLVVDVEDADPTAREGPRGTELEAPPTIALVAREPGSDHPHRERSLKCEPAAHDDRAAGADHAVVVAHGAEQEIARVEAECSGRRCGSRLLSFRAAPEVEPQARRRSRRVRV